MPTPGNGLRSGRSWNPLPSVTCQGFVCDCPHLGTCARLDRDGRPPEKDPEAVGAELELPPRNPAPASAPNFISYWSVNARGRRESFQTCRSPSSGGATHYPDFQHGPEQLGWWQPTEFLFGEIQRPNEGDNLPRITEQLHSRTHTSPRLPAPWAPSFCP